MNSALSEYYELVGLHQAVVAQRDGLLDMNQYTTQENHALGSQLQQRNVEIAQIRAVLAKKDERIAELEAKNQEFMTHAAAQASKICRLQDCLTVLGEENVELRAKLDQSDNLQPEEGQAPVADLSPIASEQPEEVPAYVADPLPVVQATEDVLTVVRDTLALISQAASQIGQELVTAKAELDTEIMFEKVKEVTIRREKANEEKKLRQMQEAEERQRAEESRKADRARRQEAAKERKIAEKALKAKQREENKQKLEAKCVEKAERRKKADERMEAKRNPPQAAEPAPAASPIVTDEKPVHSDEALQPTPAKVAIQPYVAQALAALSEGTEVLELLDDVLAGSNLEELIARTNAPCPGHDDPEGRKQWVQAKVTVSRLVKELAPPPVVVEDPVQNTAKYARFCEFVRTKVFNKDKLPKTKFAVHETDYYSAENLVCWYIELKLGMDTFELFGDGPGQYYLCHKANDQFAFVSRKVEIETIVRWLDDEAFVNACRDYFPKAMDFFHAPNIGFYLKDVKVQIEHAFQCDMDDPVYKTLNLRPYMLGDEWVEDVFGVKSYVITDHKGKDFYCPMLQLVIWFEMNLLHIMASRFAD